MRTTPVNLTTDPYDELPYPSVPIEWSAPERLALASLLHGGPRPTLDRYRLLELGCGDGANLLPLAYYRRQATFVGIDGAGTAIATAEARRRALGLPNLDLIHADFADFADLGSAGARLTEPFDFILMHGVLSWVPPDVGDDLLALCARCLRPGGLLYLNYNARPGWTVRGLVRDLLLDQTRSAGPDLQARAARAQEVAATLAASFGAAGAHPYSLLMQREFRIVCDSHPSYVAHEYLAADNHAFWRSDLLARARHHGLTYVADADFNFPSGRIDDDLPRRVADPPLDGGTIADTVDLLLYRQLHSPILTTRAPAPRPPEPEEIARLTIASCLAPEETTGGHGEAEGAREPGTQLFLHPSGLEVVAKTPPMGAAFQRLLPRWPRGLRVDALFDDVGAVFADLALLYRHGLIDLRLVDVGADAPAAGPLHACEAEWGQGAAVTTPYHTRLSI